MGSATQEKQDILTKEIEGEQRRPISRFLLQDGDGTSNAIGNYASDTIFTLLPAVNEIWRIQRLIVLITDNATLSYGGYGAGSALTNGIKIYAVNAAGAPEYLFIDRTQLKTNEDWAKIAIVNQITIGAANQALQCIYDFDRGGQDLRLVGSRRDLYVSLNDNFSGLTGHYFYIQGYVEQGAGLTQ